MSSRRGIWGESVAVHVFLKASPVTIISSFSLYINIFTFFPLFFSPALQINK